MKSLKRRLNAISYPLGVIVLIVVLWEVVVRVFNVPVSLVPAPSVVFNEIIRRAGYLASNALLTLWEALVGFFFAALVGFSLGVLLSLSSLVRRTVYPLLVTIQVWPKIALAPLIVVLLGWGMLPKVLISFIIGVLPMVINTLAGMLNTSDEAFHLAHSMGASGRQIFFRIKLPNAMPCIFAGLKIAVTLALIGAFLAEYLASGRGLGVVLLVAYGAANAKLLFAGAAIMSILGYILFLIIDGAERLAIPWHVSQRGEAAEARETY
ncbi:ABC transporter permease [Chloroflexota bacterium]